MSVSTKDLRALAIMMRADPECDEAAKMIEEAADEIENLAMMLKRTARQVNLNKLRNQAEGLLLQYGFVGSPLRGE